MTTSNESRQLLAPEPHHWTLEEYHRAIDAGVFGDRRLELLHGEVVDRLGWQRTTSQTPIILPSDGEPEPDVAVFELGAPLKPIASHVQLVIEVSQATRRRDLGSKLDDYLRDNLHEVWIVDLVEQCALIYRGGLLVARHVRGTGAQLVAELVPEVSVDLDEVFRAARLP